MAGRFKDKPECVCCGILDGDQSLAKQSKVNLFLKPLESIPDPVAATEWIENRIEFLPGNTWPECWIVGKHSEGAFVQPAVEYGVEAATFDLYMEEAIAANKHDELRVLSQKVGLTVAAITGRFAKCALEQSQQEVKSLSDFIGAFLDQVCS